MPGNPSIAYFPAARLSHLSLPFQIHKFTTRTSWSDEKRARNGGVADAVGNLGKQAAQPKRHPLEATANSAKAAARTPPTGGAAGVSRSSFNVSTPAAFDDQARWLDFTNFAELLHVQNSLTFAPS
jgi:hypothetical protein